jgi:excisionase family DNA binding protein
VARLETLPDVLTAREAMEVCRLSKNAFYRLVASGDIPAIRFGRSLRFSKAAIAALIDPAAPRIG